MDESVINRLDQIIARTVHFSDYGNATHVPELAQMVKGLAEDKAVATYPPGACVTYVGTK